MRNILFERRGKNDNVINISSNKCPKQTKYDVNPSLNISQTVFEPHYSQLKVFLALMRNNHRLVIILFKH